MTIIKYTNTKTMNVEFEDGYISKNVSYDEFSRKLIRNPYNKTVFGIGYIGEIDESIGLKRSSDEYIRAHRVWRGLFERCYNPKVHEHHPTYKSCRVCEEWHNFQKFLRWYLDNYYTIEGTNVHIDKDILYKHNNVYSPNTCIFVPERINYMFRANYSKNNRNGVSYDKNRRKYQSSYRDVNNICVNLGRYRNKQDAILAHNRYKFGVFCDFIEKYQDQIPKSVIIDICEKSWILDTIYGERGEGE